ncbi:hypothetical protein THRCLA_21211 [Thraustotheca clavata]|uniref:Uncharacterized protein n=1 Tax=Thraustotheca clavata TaxID=74557 RepID=A0A1V9ZYV9_9STRA|nr:hypothetical protein THRCLA_21211 [Thraustotheca clavata]
MSLDEINFCLYTNKLCKNPRSIKRNGSLHGFCDYHRMKANAIQKSHANKKRLLQKTSDASRLLIADELAVPAAAIQPITHSSTANALICQPVEGGNLDDCMNQIATNNVLTGDLDINAEDYAILNKLL